MRDEIIFNRKNPNYNHFILAEKPIKLSPLGNAINSCLVGSIVHRAM